MYKKSFNESFFEKIDTEAKAYWLGFLAADGSLTSNRNRITLGLAKKDRTYVVKFKKTIQLILPIQDRTRILKTKKGEVTTYLSRIRFDSKKMYSDLIDKGVTPRKSLTLKPPIGVPGDLIKHWIRGYFDGDGSVHIYIDKRGGRNSLKLRTSFIGTKEVLNFINHQVGIDQSIRQADKSRAWMIRTSGPTDGIKLYHYLYDEATIFMKRKKVRFEEYLKWRREHGY